MKKIMKQILVVAIVFATLSSNATETALFTNEEDGRTTLVFENVIQGDQLLVKDAFGLILYNEAISKSGQYNKSFDLTTLPNGSYFFELDKKMQTRIYPFTVENTIVKFDKDNLTIINKPRVRVEDNTIIITASNLDKVDYSVEIYYNSSDSIFSETYFNTTHIGKKYKLEKEKKGEYAVVVTTKDRTFTYTVSI
ncbi:MAG: hypothetical protein WBF67_00860 [Olleya sp.]